MNSEFENKSHVIEINDCKYGFDFSQLMGWINIKRIFEETYLLTSLIISTKNLTIEKIRQKILQHEKNNAEEMHKWICDENKKEYKAINYRKDGNAAIFSRATTQKEFKFDTIFYFKQLIMDEIKNNKLRDKELLDLLTN